MNSFLAALTFLTIIPMPQHLTAKCNFEGCQKFFPLIGIIIGLITSIGCYIFYLIFPGLVAAALSVVLLIKITGGLHLDGLSDTADGFFSYRDRARTLEIMKDSCLGSMGSIAQICLIFLKISAVYELSDSSFLALFIAPIVGRTAILFISFSIPPAQSKGLGYTINSGTSKAALGFGIIISLLFSTLLFAVTGFIAVVLALATPYILGKISEKKIGGYTGDVLGAGCEISEMLTLIILSTTII